MTKTDALESLVIASFVRGLSVRDVEATLAEALGDQAAISKSTVATVCQAIRDGYQQSTRRAAPTLPDPPFAQHRRQDPRRHAARNPRRLLGHHLRHQRPGHRAGAEARRGRRQRITAFAAKYRELSPSAMTILDIDRAGLTAYLRFPREHHVCIRHSNFIERTFGETKRRTKVIGLFSGETSAVSLVWVVFDVTKRHQNTHNVYYERYMSKSV